MPKTLLDNRYALGKLLGSGGMAEVYVALDELLENRLHSPTVADATEVDQVTRRSASGVKSFKVG